MSRCKVIHTTYPAFQLLHFQTFTNHPKLAFAMKHWEKSKKDLRRDDDRPHYSQDNHKKKKLRPIEKTKYRLRGGFDDYPEE